MKTEICAGQLYRITLTGRTEHQQTVMELISIGTSADDVATRLPYVADLGEFDSYRVDRIEKIGRAHVVRMQRLSIVPSQPAAVLSRRNGSDCIWQEATKPDGRRFSVIARTSCYAKTAQHAIRKMAERMAAGSESVTVTAEELGQPSGYAMPRDQSQFHYASFVRG